MIFRDCPELAPPVEQLPRYNVSLWHQVVDMSVTTQWKKGQEEEPEPQDD